MKAEGSRIVPSNRCGQQRREQPAALGAFVDGQVPLVGLVVGKLDEKLTEEDGGIGAWGNICVIVYVVRPSFAYPAGDRLIGNGRDGP